MSTNAIPATGGESPRRALVNAKTVGWALTAITAISLLLGLAAVQLLGRQTPALDVEKEPSQAARQPAPTEHAKPIILPSAATPGPGAPATAPHFEQRLDSGPRFGARAASFENDVK